MLTVHQISLPLKNIDMLPVKGCLSVIIIHVATLRQVSLEMHAYFPDTVCNDWPKAD